MTAAAERVALAETAIVRNSSFGQRLNGIEGIPAACSAMEKRMLFLSMSDRREARMRAPDYAHYCLDMYGDAAEAHIDQKLALPDLTRYRIHMLRLTRRELARLRRRRRQATPSSRQAARRS